MKSSPLSALVRKIVDSSILAKINLTGYPNQDHIVEMKQLLGCFVKKFIVNYQSLPKHVFLSKYCKKQSTKPRESDKARRTRRRRNPKRPKPDDNDDSDVAEEPSKQMLEKFVDVKSVYCFARRCLMHVLDYKGKTNSENNNGAQLVGGLFFSCLHFPFCCIRSF
jgi:hypothetical protein